MDKSEWVCEVILKDDNIAYIKKIGDIYEIFTHNSRMGHHSKGLFRSIQSAIEFIKTIES